MTAIAWQGSEVSVMAGIGSAIWSRQAPHSHWMC
jgi:hypothetical protein